MVYCRSFVLALACVSAFTAPVHAAARSSIEVFDGIGLIVNQRAIGRQQLQADLRILARKLPSAGLSQAQYEQTLLETLIGQYLLEDMRKASKIVPNQAEIEAAISGIAEKNRLSVETLLRNVVRETGLSVAQYREEIAQEIIDETLKGKVSQAVMLNPQMLKAQTAQVLRAEGSQVWLKDLLIPVPEGDAYARAAVVKHYLRLIADRQSVDMPLERVVAQLATEIAGAQYNDLGQVNLAQLPAHFAHAVATLEPEKMIAHPIVDDDGMHFLFIAERDEMGGAIINTAPAALYGKAVEDAWQTQLDAQRASAHIELR